MKPSANTPSANTPRTCPKCGGPTLSRVQSERQPGLCGQCKAERGQEVRRILRLLCPTWVKKPKEVAHLLGVSDKTIAYHQAIIRREDLAHERRLRCAAA